MKIAVAGTGYMGLSNAILLSQHNTVVAVDIIQSKVDLINSRKSPIVDKEIEEYLAQKDLNLTDTVNAEQAYENADYVLISTPTNYDPEMIFFDTSSIESVLDMLNGMNSKAVIVIKSTIPVGYTEGLQRRYPGLSIIFSPEFLREGHALYDNLYPSRIVVSYPKGKAELKTKAVEFAGSKVIKDLNRFKSECDVIIANRLSEELKDAKEKVYTRDLYSRD